MARTQSYTHIHVCIVCIYNIQKDYIYIYIHYMKHIHTYRQGPYSMDSDQDAGRVVLAP